MRKLTVLSASLILAGIQTTALAAKFTGFVPAVSGGTASAQEYNDNFIGAGGNSGVIGTANTNVDDIATNAAAIATKADQTAVDAAIATKADQTDVDTNTADIATNTTDIAALQGGKPGTTCEGTDAGDIMVRVGPLCVDKYEASVWNTAAGGGTQYGNVDFTPVTVCADNGSDCGAGAANPIFARSQESVDPSSQITWYQAAQACANVGKRLPTIAEWQMAASGTVDPGQSDGSLGCLTDSAGGRMQTGEAASCNSTAGVSDMIGNLWEWAANLEFAYSPTSDGDFQSTDNATVPALGNSHSFIVGRDTSTKSIVMVGTGAFAAGPNTKLNAFGFRCVR